MPPLDLHEWISFEDDHEQRTWVFDATFLRSNWSCIYGAGCKGVLDARRHRARPGLLQLRRPLRRRRRRADRARRARPARAAPLAEPQEGPQQGRPRDRGRRHQDPRRRRRVHLPQPARLRRRRRLRAAHRRARGRRAATSTGSPTCAGSCRCASSTTPTTTATSPRRLREWKRRDWGEGGDEFHWWCTESDDAFVGGAPVYQYLRDEIIEMVGQAAYDQMVIAARTPAVDPAPPPRHPPLSRAPTVVAVTDMGAYGPFRCPASSGWLGADLFVGLAAFFEAEVALADADRLRGDLDQLVVGDPLDRRLQRVDLRRRAA